MRRLLSLVILFALSVPAWAAAPQKPDAVMPKPARQTWQHQFAEANLARDGHLTLGEATAGYSSVAKHFSDIDADHKGYITVEDIQAWRIVRKAARRLTKPPEDKLRPQPAVERIYNEPRKSAASRL